MKTCFLVTLSLLTLSALPTAQATAPSVAPAKGSEVPVPITNPGFEAGMSGWDARGGQGQARALPEAAYRGAAGLRVDGAPAATGFTVNGIYLPAQPGCTYKLSFFARTVSGKGIGVRLGFYDSNRKLLPVAAPGSETVHISPSASVFTPLSIVSQAPTEAVFVRAWIHTFSKSDVTADFDEFVLTEMP